MPDYRRLVSYMYNYEDGIKRNNVGYARVEARNGQCKCTLHIAAPSLNEKQLKAYIFKRNKGGLQGVLLGTFYVRNGIGDYRVITEAAHIMNTPYSLDEMGGIVLYLSDKKFFATEWDDSPITKELVSTIEEKQEKKENNEQLKVEIKNEINKEPEKLQEPDAKDESEIVKAAGVKIINIKTEYFNNEPVTETNTDKKMESKVTKPETNNNNTPTNQPTLENQPDQENPCGKLFIDTPESNNGENNENEDNTNENNGAERRQNTTDDSPMNKNLPEPQSLETESLNSNHFEANPQNDMNQQLIENQQVEEEQYNEAYQQAEEEQYNEVKYNEVNQQVEEEQYKEGNQQPDEDQQNDSYHQMEVEQQHNDEDETVDDFINLDNVFSIPRQKKEYYEEIALESDELEKEADLYDSLEEELDQGDVISESLNNNESLDDTVESAGCKTEQPKPFFEDHPLAKRIYRSFPRMYPFEDNEIAWCVKIEPQDIGLFPMEAWVLGNNSFLLHGYYSYRHLIFARMNDKNGFSYILGVPGIYHNREKFMAKMFGFENFKSVKRIERRTGEFGYWYIPILLS
jgi:hypothetical protein